MQSHQLIISYSLVIFLIKMISYTRIHFTSSDTSTDHFLVKSYHTCKKLVFSVPAWKHIFWRNHFVAASFVVALYGVAHFVVSQFWSGLFWREFYENNLFLLPFLFSIFFKVTDKINS